MKARMHIMSKHARVLGIEAYGIGERVLGVYIQTNKAPVWRTREVIPEVFADFDRHGGVVGIEFTCPGDYSIDAMLNVSRELNIPELRAIDVSKLPVNVQEEGIVEARK